MTLPIQCYRVSVRKIDEKCIITSQALPGFFLLDATKDSQSNVVKHYIHSVIIIILYMYVFLNL